MPVRKDPTNERGPMPPGGRPEKPEPMPQVPSSLFELRPELEYRKLWMAEIMNLSYSLHKIQAYRDIDLPGFNAEDLQELSHRLDRLQEENYGIASPPPIDELHGNDRS